jgi:hypothetical protein
MDRRRFLAASSAAGLVPMISTSAFAAEAEAPQQILELRQYHFTTDEQRDGFDRFMAEAAVAAINRLGIKPVGVFYPQEGAGPAWVLLPHASMESVLTLKDKLRADDEYIKAGAAFLDAPAAQPAYARMESSLMRAFRGMPQVERPSAAAERVLQLRIYESPSVKTGQKKIEMFNDAGELTIFRRVGLNPVFFGETIVGAKMPNLTYMLGFDSAEAQQAAWQRFRTDADWLKLRAMPEYKDDAILVKGGITNLLLKPAACSQL